MSDADLDLVDDIMDDIGDLSGDSISESPDDLPIVLEDDTPDISITDDDGEVLDITEETKVPLEDDLLDDKELKNIKNMPMNDSLDEQVNKTENIADIVTGLDNLITVAQSEFTCTRCFLIKDQKLLSKDAPKDMPYCIYCE